jgi:alpha-glucosidase
MLLLTLRGTPTMYYGDEIGMHDVAIPPERVQDPFEKNVPGMGLGRDPQRTPMQWDDSPGAGFSSAQPWLPLADDYRTVNVAQLRKDPRSILSLYRALIDLRRAEPALSIGSYEPVRAPGDLLAFQRRQDGRQFLIVLNFSAEPHTLELPQGMTGQVDLSTHLDRGEEPTAGSLSLRGDEGVIVRLV